MVASPAVRDTYLPGDADRTDHLMTGDVPSPQTSPRVLSDNERALLDGFLRPDFDGVEALRVQAPLVLASQGCTCGCGTIALHMPAGTPRSSAHSPLPVEGEVVGADGEPIGGLLLFLDDDGRLSSLEVYTHLDDPLQLPPADEVRW
jgi:hypothetical protein